jgi:hypothetical protein
MAVLLLHDVIASADHIETAGTVQKTLLHCCCIQAAAWQQPFLLTLNFSLSACMSQYTSFQQHMLVLFPQNCPFHYYVQLKN